MLPVKCAFICHSTSSSINGKCIIQEAMTHWLWLTLTQTKGQVVFSFIPGQPGSTKAWMLKMTYCATEHHENIYFYLADMIHSVGP